MKYKDEILKLRKDGKSYNEISKILNCSKSTVCYHCNDTQKDKYKQRSRKYRSKQHPFQKKYENFKQSITREKINISKAKDKLNKVIYNKILNFHKNRITGVQEKMSFNLDDLINKFGKNTVCYLTGDKIDIYKPQTYQFDHIVPASKGGENTLDNLGICTKEANMSKTDHTVEEFIELCKKVLTHNGYKIN